MRAAFEVRYTDAAQDDLLRLFDFLLDRAESAQQLETAQQAIDSIRSAIAKLEETPFIYRKAAQSPFLRELIIPFAAAGYVALYEVAGDRLVNVLAIRHQREDDYH